MSNKNVNPLTAPSQANRAVGVITESQIEAALLDFEIANDNLYKREGKANPFLPLIKADAVAGQDASEDADNKRVPQTPLERFDVGQLRLTAVVEAPVGNSAVIVESSGRGYVVKPGTYIGRNGGQITEIKKDRIIIEEPMGKNERGEVTFDTIELVLPKPAGAF